MSFCTFAARPSPGITGSTWAPSSVGVCRHDEAPDPLRFILPLYFNRTFPNLPCNLHIFPCVVWLLFRSFCLKATCFLSQRQIGTCFSFFFFLVGVLRVSYILETKFTIIIHVCMCQRYSVIPIFKFFEMEVSAAYPTPKLKINNWEIVKVQDIVSWKKVHVQKQ